MQRIRDATSTTEAPPRNTPLASTVVFLVPEIFILSPLRGAVFYPSKPQLAFLQIKDGLPQNIQIGPS
jgi:hypothetical protein